MKKDKRIYALYLLIPLAFLLGGALTFWIVTTKMSVDGKTVRTAGTEVASDAGNAADTAQIAETEKTGDSTDNTANTDTDTNVDTNVDTNIDANTGTDNNSDSGSDPGQAASSDELPSQAANAGSRTGNLTEKGNGYEGVEGTGTYNYGEALQKSLLFYELQRSGALPEQTRCNWRGDSALQDGADAGLDLTGGWYDAGDNVKFNLPMAYTASMLGWSLLDDAEAYEESGQLEYALGNIKWANDYFIKCHPEDEVYYYQVGDGNQDHTYWGAAETVSYKMNRPSYRVTKSNPGSAVCAETAASLAICSMVFEQQDKEYSKLCLSHAESLYRFARSTLSDSGYTAANGFYNSWSGFYDELSWAGVWLYRATGEDTYLNNAKSDYTKANQDYKWAMCWDDVHIGAALLLAETTADRTYADAVEAHLDWWTTGNSRGERITYTPKGLAWLDSWGSLRYATTTAFIAATYAEWDGCDNTRAKNYRDFAKKQADYVLGDTGFSYEIGFGDKYPQHPHHRTAQGSYCDNMTEPAVSRHTLYGALVGGPDAGDNYRDEVSDYTANEVACDYNAGFTGLLAKLYKTYHGKTLKDFGAVEQVTENEFYASGGINADGQDFIEIRAYICNTSTWPARVPKELEYRYFLDLTELYEAGGSAESVAISTNYMEAGETLPLTCWDEKNHLYYMGVRFDGTNLYPGGQDAYKKEIQVRIRSTAGVWDNSNDPSYSGMKSGGNELLTKSALYAGGELVFGEEPASGENAGRKVGFTEQNTSQSDGSDHGQSGQTSAPVSTTAQNVSLSVTAEYNNMQATSNNLAGILNIKNDSDGSLSLSDLKMKYYFTNENDIALDFSCYHAALSSPDGNYRGIDGCTGTFEDAEGEDADTVCVISFSDRMQIEAGDTLIVNFCINHSDWSNMTTTNDHSVKSEENIVILHQGQKIYGTEP